MFLLIPELLPTSIVIVSLNVAVEPLLISGGNERQIDAIADEVERQLSLLGEKPTRRESSENWILLDYQDLVVHVQTQQARQYYSLDRLWNDCPSIKLDALAAAEAFKAGK